MSGAVELGLIHDAGTSDAPAFAAPGREGVPMGTPKRGKAAIYLVPRKE